MPKRWSDLHSLECFPCDRVAISMIIGLKNSKRVMVSILRNSPAFSLSLFLPLQVHLQIPFWVRKESSVGLVSSELKCKEISNSDRKFVRPLYHL